MTTSLYVFVPGEPVPQGSLRPSGTGHLYYSNAAKLKPARAAITAALEGAAAAAGHEQWMGPVRLEVEFRFPRLKSHYRTNGEVKPNAPLYKISAPDTDKLVRLVDDAATDSRVFKDDAQVVDIVARKRYADGDQPVGTHIRITALE
jgi:Holliday junction resolvase RusA-like endonuclease